MVGRRDDVYVSSGLIVFREVQGLYDLHLVLYPCDLQMVQGLCGLRLVLDLCDLVYHA